MQPAKTPILANTDPARRVRLTWQVSRYFSSNTDALRVRIEASDANLMPSKIFAYLTLPAGTGTGVKTAAFDHICSPVDIEEYPEDEPLPNARPAWFRLNYVDVLLRSREEVDSFITGVRADVEALKQALDRTDVLETGASVWVGPAPDPE